MTVRFILIVKYKNIFLGHINMCGLNHVLLRNRNLSSGIYLADTPQLFIVDVSVNEPNRLKAEGMQSKTMFANRRCGLF